jgi:hypothetical protein
MALNIAFQSAFYMIYEESKNFKGTMEDLTKGFSKNTHVIHTPARALPKAYKSVTINLLYYIYTKSP